MDIYISDFLNNFAGRWRIFDMAVFFKAEYLGWWMLAGLGLFLIFASYKNKGLEKAKRMVLAAIASGILSRFVFTEIIRLFYNRPRPFEVSDVFQLVLHGGGGSFPSGHAAFFFAVAAAVFIYYKKWGILFYLLALAMGIARVVAGIHWPSDILGGAVIGIASAYLVNYIFLKYKNGLFS